MQLELWSARGDAQVAPREGRARARVQTHQAELVATPVHITLARDLDALAARAQQYVRDAKSERTRQLYRTDWRTFERWCDEHGVRALPATPATLACYLTHLAELGRKASTIRRARVAVGVIHGLQGHVRPDQDDRIRALERGIGRTHGTREQGATPLLVEQLEPMMAVLGDSARDDRDRALVLLGFAGAYRAADLTRLNIEHITFASGPSGAMTVLLPRSKEDSMGRGAITEIPAATHAALCPIRAMRTWMARVGRPQGPLFRLVFGHAIEPIRIQPRAVSRAVQRLAARAGLRGDYSAHSLRSGLATSAYAHGATEREIQSHGRWKDRRSLDRYIHLSAVDGRPNVAASVLQ